MSQEYATLIGTRVQAGDALGILRGRTEAGLWIVQDEHDPGSRVLAQGELTPALLTCQGCGDEVSRLFQDLCASCYRAHAREREQVPGPRLCPQCGKGGAIRNPQDVSGRLLCASCWAKADMPLSTGPKDVSTHDHAACAGALVSDPRHAWVNVKGSRWRCTSCRTDHFGSDPRVSS